VGCGKWNVSCDDGFSVTSKNQGELVALTQWHVKHSHSKDISHDDVMKMAKHP
jgi:predicted small metal-binding protein